MKRILFLLFFCMIPLSVWAATTYYVTPQYTIASCASDGSSGVFLNVSTSGFGVRQGLGLPITVSGVTGCNAGINATYTSAQYTATSTQIDLPGVAYSMPLTVMGKISNGSNTAPYTTWATATPYLETILPLLATSDQIWIQAGTLYPRDAATHLIPTAYHNFAAAVSGWQMYGSFVGTETTVSQRPGFVLNAIYPPTGLATTTYIPMGSITDTASTPSLYGWSNDTGCLFHTCIDGTNGASYLFEMILPSANTNLWIIDGIETRKGNEALYYNNPSTISNIKATVQNCLGTGNKSDFEFQGPGINIKNYLSMRPVLSGASWVLDMSTSAIGSWEQVVVDGTGMGGAFAGNIVTFDSGSGGSINGLTIKNFTTAKSVINYSPGSISSNLAINNLIISNVTSSYTGAAYGGIITVGGATGNSMTLTHANILNYTLTGGPQGLFYVTGTLNIYDSQMGSLGYTGNNAFVYGTSSAANLFNATMDGTATNNSTSSTNSPIGYYRAPGSGFGGF